MRAKKIFKECEAVWYESIKESNSLLFDAGRSNDEISRAILVRAKETDTTGRKYNKSFVQMCKSSLRKRNRKKIKHFICRCLEIRVPNKREKQEALEDDAWNKLYQPLRDSMRSQTDEWINRHISLFRKVVFFKYIAPKINNTL